MNMKRFYSANFPEVTKKTYPNNKRKKEKKIMFYI